MHGLPVVMQKSLRRIVYSDNGPNKHKDRRASMKEITPSVGLKDISAHILKGSPELTVFLRSSTMYNTNWLPSVTVLHSHVVTFQK